MALLSFLLQAVDGSGSRIAVTCLVGFRLALGPSDHVVVTMLHAALGLRLGAAIEAEPLARVAAVGTAGDLVGGIGLVAPSHAAEGRGGRPRARR